MAARTCLIVTGYSINTPYEEEVKKFIDSLNDHHITNYKVYPFDSKGSWAKNCQQKAIILKQALTEQKENVCWVDADAVFLNPPILLGNIASEIAYHYFEKRKEVLTGTLYLKNCPIVLSLVDEWIKVNNSNNEWDQRNLQAILQSTQYQGISTTRLPAEYCKIFDSDQITPHPVIIHNQASRRFKSRIK